MEKSVTILISKEIHEKLLKNKKEKGVSIQFQINEILKKELKITGKK